jgi:hypothetical protein
MQKYSATREHVTWLRGIFNITDAAKLGLRVLRPLLLLAARGDDRRQFEQVVDPKVRSPCRYGDERIWIRRIRPARRQVSESLIAIEEVHPVLAPRLLACQQIKRLAMQRVEGMDYSDSSCTRRIASSRLLL